MVRLHTGDPSLYGAIFEQMSALDARNIPFAVVPGVTAAFAAAAAMGLEYTLPEISQTLILTRMAGRTPVPESENLEALASHQASMAIYLSISLIDAVQATLSRAYGPDAACAIAYKISHPEERIVYTRINQLSETVQKENITRQALIIVGKVLEVTLDSLKHHSKLYDKAFTHGFREKVAAVNIPGPQQLAIWAITPGGLSLALKLMDAFPGMLHVSERSSALPCSLFFIRPAGGLRQGSIFPF